MTINPIFRVGWLLASLSPGVIAKGEQELAELPPADRSWAQAHARALVRLYRQHTSPRMASAYDDHAYYTEDET
jgi:hypothetical protein